MADITKALSLELRNTATITAYTSQRIYPMLVPEGASYPALVYTLISDPPHHVMGQDAPIYSPRVQLDTYSTSFSDVKSISAAVSVKMRDFTGNLGSSSSPQTFVKVARSFIENTYDDMVIDETQNIKYKNVQDYIIWYTTV